MKRDLERIAPYLPQLRKSWFVICQSGDLKSKPLGRKLLGTRLVLFRDSAGEVAVLEDRCPHRNAPLSQGRVRGGCVTCPYHGWRFGSDGVCRHIPEHPRPEESQKFSVARYPVREQEGYVWVYATADVEPASEPYSLPLREDNGSTTLRRELVVNATFDACVENFIDHTHQLTVHPSWFRKLGITDRVIKNEPRDIEVSIRRTGSQVEACFIKDARPEGLLPRLMSPLGKTIYHADRFLLPSIAQVEYRYEGNGHVMTTIAVTPISERRSHCFLDFSFHLALPGWFVKPIYDLIHRRVLSQDKRILRLQEQTIRDYRGTSFVNTEVDVLGPHIRKLLSQPERPDPNHERTMELTKTVVLRA